MRGVGVFRLCICLSLSHTHNTLSHKPTHKCSQTRPSPLHPSISVLLFPLLVTLFAPFSTLNNRNALATLDIAVSGSVKLSAKISTTSLAYRSGVVVSTSPRAEEMKRNHLPTYSRQTDLVRVLQGEPHRLLDFLPAEEAHSTRDWFVQDCCISLAKHQCASRRVRMRVRSQGG